MKNLSQSLIDKAKSYSSLENEQKKKLLETLYQDHGLSWITIGELTDTYAQKVRRDAQKLGIKSKSKSEAQKAALQSGRHKHPTKDVGHSEASKIKISDSIADNWKNMDEKEKERRRETAKELWNEKSPEELRAFREASGEGVRQAAKHGSALEKYLLKELIGIGHTVHFHKEQWVVRENLQIDLFLPKLNVAIEVDGPSHFKDIWGEENLMKNQQRDMEKTGLLLERGVCIIRIRQTRPLSKKYKREIFGELVEHLKKIEKSFPPKGQRHIIIGDIYE